MGKVDDFFRGGRRRRERNDYEFYEDTHNENGEYTGTKQDPTFGFSFSQTPTMQNRQQQQGQQQAQPQGETVLPNRSDYISPRQYQNVVVYEPKSPDDVQMLIDYLKRREPAIINLDNVDPPTAQRILDFTSGAIYALSGSVHRIAGNIFLLSPEGVEITVPYVPTGV